MKVQIHRQQLIDKLSELRPGDAAKLLLDAAPELRAGLLLEVSPGRAADLLDELPDDIAASAVAALMPEQAALMVQEMQTDEAVDLLQALRSSDAEAILKHVRHADAVVARKLLTYDEDSAGGLMQAEFIAIRAGMLAREVVQYLRANSEHYADYPASYLYVVDEVGRLDGVVSMRDLVLCEAETPVTSIKADDIVTAAASLPGQDLLRLFTRFHFLAIPVVDEDSKLLGIVTQQDAMEFAEEDADEEMLRLSGIAGGDELRTMGFFHRTSRRLSWLSVNAVLNVLAASIIASYQDTLEAAIILAMFLPIISDMSGCSGNQAVAVSIRELSLDRIHPKSLLWVLRREVFVGAFNGLALGGLIGGIAWLWKGEASLAFVLGTALWANTVLAVMIGGAVPLVLKRFGWDPALASSPILTTLTDSSGFFITLSLAAQTFGATN
jgi:magnesium transporter